MALTANAIPSQVPDFATPFDAMTAFGEDQVITATGYVNNLNSGLIDLGGALPSSGAGRTDGMWCNIVNAIDIVTTDEFYRLFLLGSNDVAFGNGNVELVAMHDFAALAANRIVPTIMGATPTIPPSGLVGTHFKKPFTNLVGRIVYRWLKCYIVAGGTTPSITITSWISKAEIKV